ncbi:MAG: Transketolase domain protein [Candidatus Uhrbacteria bacterium GW2011_GWD2_52_7]|uniref:Transketolase domain protein n=1 Tax=Candidatus Uhrbacteria bacterium GW2011_GWD2_52_7 TaxID=1618989 RepID=A0A0G1XGL1_9BACT|nr:MAG: Transketolase domain protein [Candidatus Uhrbacteria bacterium GW2011_GWD2_52_7]
MPSVRQAPLLTEKKLLALEKKANEVRQDILSMLTTAGSGHSAGPLGMADIFTALYFHVLQHDPKRPNWKDRDRLFLSNGHIVPVRYAAMAHAGYFPKSELATLRKFGSKLQGHPEVRMMPALENTSGPLGDGSSQAVGAAYVAKMDRLPWHTYCVMSDGELAAGITWEAALFAAKNNLNNLTWIIDRNNIQIDGYTEEIMPLERLHEKFAAFGFTVLEIDGHNMRQFIDACDRSAATWETPTVIIAHTIPGKGVKFMEFEPSWHGKPPKDKTELNAALRDLRTLGGKIDSEAL